MAQSAHKVRRVRPGMMELLEQQVLLDHKAYKVILDQRVPSVLKDHKVRREMTGHPVLLVQMD
jgi:hypothetical protein